LRQLQQWCLKRGQVFSRDVGDSWNINTSALAELLATLFEWRDRIVILSGDIHYSSVVRLDYWLSNDPSSRVLVQLTSSSLNNAELLTQLSHTKIKSSLFPEPQRFWSIWERPWRMKEVKNLQQASHLSADRFCTLKWIRRQPVRLLNVNVEKTYSLPKPHFDRNNWLSLFSNLLKRLWHNKWLQEGTEVVGVNNISLVRFDRSDDSEICSIVQNTYWYASWYGDRLVYSRFKTSLQQRQYREKSN
jgi:hypothetical protein